MRRLIAIATFISLLPSGLAAQSRAANLNPLSHCGTERWHIKTLDDAGVNHIAQIPQETTISQLNDLSIPADYDANDDADRYHPVEFEKFSIEALLTGFKEEADRDLHLVLADPTDPSVTMVGEVPDPSCSTVQASGHAAQIAKVRASFISCFGQPPANSRLKRFSRPMRIQISGVGFFDKIHGQTGVAQNGIELHPILSVKTISGTCPTGFVQQ